MYLIGFILVLFIILFICISVKSTINAWKKSISNNFPPGPRPLPLIGNLHLINLKRPQKTFVELSKKYGSVFSIQLGMKKMVVLAGYETVKDALVHHGSEFGERAHVPIFEDINNGFGKPFDITEIMNFAVANIIISIVLGHRFDYDHPRLLMVTQLVTENLRLIGSPMVNLYNLFPALYFLPGNHKTVHQNIKDIHSFLRKTFLASRNELKSEEKRNFIEAFLIKEKEEKTNPNSYFHDENLLCVVTSLFTAGTDTTSATLRWGCLLMMKFPDIQRKVQEEIDRVIGLEQPNTVHRKLMPYTDAVLHEVQRFGNILPLGLPRETTVDTNFKGFFIPKGTHIIPLLESVLYDKSQFATPEEFNPQHFLDSDGKFVKNEALMNFGAGRRICIGETLARMELFLFFTSLLQKCTLRLPPGVTHTDFTPAVGFTTPPKPYEICALPRC